MKGSTFKRCSCLVEYDTRGRRKACNKRHGSWSFVVDVGADPKTGNRRQVRRGGFRTQDEAQKALDAVIGKVRRHEPIDDRMTVGEWLAFWLAEKTKPTGASAAGKKIRPATAQVYRQHVDDYLLPQLGRVALAKLTAEHITKGYDAILADNALKTKGRKFGPTTLKRIHACLSSALNAAVKAQRISRNPAAYVTLPDATRPKVNPWSPAELGAFLDHVAAHRLGSLFEVIAFCGLRRGEALGLRWRDVDMSAGILVVPEQLAGVKNGEPIFAPPKSDSGDDVVIELSQATIGALMAHRLQQDLERSEWGTGYAGHDLVFARENGAPYEPTYITKTFKALAIEAGLRPVRLHDLRHGTASLMIGSGASLAVVSKVLRHSSHAITADTYTHLLGGVGRAAAEGAVAMVPRADRDQPAASVTASERLRDQSVTTGPLNVSEAPSADVRKEPLTSGDAGAPPGTRTPNPLIKSQLLCQLS
ncbi:site-specific recombinase XerD [Kribbella rubisoli]|uniref:Site-specific recombinase XerD n=1 Tax=Kribbella rubisoli TaxID=3075929 RepID=A0A4Q7X0Q1_9ACTN|nr:site-specific recombinase XerD [Kribbella rubisoli]